MRLGLASSNVSTTPRRRLRDCGCWRLGTCVRRRGAVSAALAGIVEVVLDNDEEKNACLKPTSITSELRDLAGNLLIREDVSQWVLANVGPARENLRRLTARD